MTNLHTCIQVVFYSQTVWHVRRLWCNKEKCNTKAQKCARDIFLVIKIIFKLGQNYFIPLGYVAPKVAVKVIAKVRSSSLVYFLRSKAC